MVLGTLLAASGCGEFGDPTVASIGSDSITLRDLRRALADLSPSDRPHLDTREQRAAFVESVVARRLLEEEGYIRF